MRYPYQDDSDVEFGYAEAARRLAASFRGQPIDDAILMPFMYLWRHAVELSLKQQIKYAATLRGPTAKMMRRSIPRSSGDGS